MAFNARQVYPNDLRPSRAIGFDLPIDGNAVFIPNFQTRDAIKNNLINYLLTNPGERPLNPEFGAGLRNFIFNAINTDNFKFLKEDIQTKIANNFSNVNVNEVTISRTDTSNEILVNITYSIPNTGINDELILNFN
jgi:phage baseplate assembly protein W|tara:strand:+ start:226 stop:633 length:408 start_codon:yes stop_codon:yes gene_type:complete